ncbi:MAG: hypothetical protein AAF702_28980 [Chloroflexota bacterium]
MRMRPFQMGALLCILLFGSITLTHSGTSAIPGSIPAADRGTGITTQDTRSKPKTPTNLVLAQSDGPKLPRLMPVSGGGIITETEATGGELRSTVSFGQTFTGITTGGNYTLATGFWNIPKVDRVLAIYALALDNDPVSTNNLTAYHRASIKAITAATAGNSEKIAIVLVDLTGDGNTRLLQIENGIAWPITTLPAVGDEPAMTIREFDMTNGKLLGRVIKWARDTHPADNSYFAYIGHGLPLAPKTDVTDIFPESVTASSVHAVDDILPPLPPSRKLSHPDITDFNDEGLISPYELQQALEIGTDGGQNPLTVLDLTHCFAASIEEFYELSNPEGQPYAEVMIGSPNYTYFGPEIMRRSLVSMTPDQTASGMANAIVRDYHQVLLEADAKITDTNEFGGHPHLLVAVDSSKLQPIKDTIDAMSSALLEPGIFNEIKISDAYTNSLKYDTTYCAPQDWETKPPDGLSDLADFVTKLADEYSTISEVQQHASAISTLVESAIITSTSKIGRPWFAETDPKPLWEFGGSGLALYTDFVGEKGIDEETNEETQFISWHSYWYTDTVRLASNETTKDFPNEHPFAFVQSEDSKTWADVFHRVWQSKSARGDFCLPEFPPVVTDGELSFERVIFPLDFPGMLSVGIPSRFAVAVRTEEEAQNALVEFKIADSNGVFFTNTVSAGDMITGVHMVETTFVPRNVGTMILTATVDSNNSFIEGNEGDNIITESYIVDTGSSPRPVISATIPSQWVAGSQLDVTISQGPGITVADLQIYAYQYQAEEGAPNTQVAKKVNATQSELDDGSILMQAISKTIELGEPISIPLSRWPLTPGPVEMHIWGKSGANPTRFPAIVKFNYTPSDIEINSGETQYFLFSAGIGDEIHLNLNVEDDVNTDANLFVWHTDNYWSVDDGSIDKGDDDVNFEAPFNGEYIVGVYGETNAIYDLMVSHIQGPLSDVFASHTFYENEQLSLAVHIPNSRPIFLPAIPTPPQPPVYLPIVLDNYSSSASDLTITNMVAVTDNVQLTIRNQGEITVTNDFWVDVYVDPNPTPSGPNQIWTGLSFQGMVWAVTGPALPLPPGASVSLTLNDRYYTSTLSVFTSTLEVGTIVYAQVDSANANTSYGAVFELDEFGGELSYNNIMSTTVISNAVVSVVDFLDSDGVNDASRRDVNLPVRPSTIGVKEEWLQIAEPLQTESQIGNQQPFRSTIWLPFFQGEGR